MRIKRIHHLTVAVRDLEQARSTFEALFEVASDEPGTVQAFGVRKREMALGDDVLQLAAPLDPGTPIMRFIERKGEGFYNLALEVDDIEAAVSELAGRGIKVSEPIEATPGVRSAFVTMAATHGLSIQLVEVAGDEAASSGEHEDDAIREPPPDASPLPAPAPLDLTPDEWSDSD